MTCTDQPSALVRDGCAFERPSLRGPHATNCLGSNAGPAEVPLPIALRERKLPMEEAEEIRRILDDPDYPTHVGKPVAMAEPNVAIPLERERLLQAAHAKRHREQVDEDAGFAALREMREGQKDDAEVGNEEADRGLRKLSHVCESPATHAGIISHQHEHLAEEVRRLREACSVQNDEICQTLGQALDYPWFKGDQVNFPGATEADGVFVGEHVAETMAAEMAREVRRLREENAVLRAILVEIAVIDEKLSAILRG